MAGNPGESADAADMQEALMGMLEAHSAEVQVGALGGWARPGGLGWPGGWVGERQLGLPPPFLPLLPGWLQVGCNTGCTAYG